MDTPTLIATLVVAVVSALLAFRQGLARGRAEAAVQRAELDALRSAGELLKREHDAALAAASAARSAEASALASYRAAEDVASTLRTERDAERRRADVELDHRTRLEQELATLRTQLDEREQNLAEQKRLVEQAEERLKDAFKATGADVMREAVDGLVKQAQAQFDQQKELSNAELDLRRQAVENSVKPLQEQLAKQEQLVRELAEKREGDAKALGEQLKSISQLQIDTSKAAQSLSSALRDNRQRGRWGEVSLRNIAEMAGLVDQVDFVEQHAVDGEEGRLRPDMVVNLPGGRKVPVDAKVPMSAYLDSLSHDIDDQRRAHLRSEHAKALRNHVRALAGRDYARQMEAPVDITVLFVPLESGLIAALEEDVTIYTAALDQNVVIVTASTLLAFLRTCALQWRQEAVNENAKQIGESAKELLKRFSRFSTFLADLGDSLTKTTDRYNKAVATFDGRLLPGAKSMAQLASSSEPMKLPSPVEKTPRLVRTTPQDDPASGHIGEGAATA